MLPLHEWGQSSAAAELALKRGRSMRAQTHTDADTRYDWQPIHFSRLMRTRAADAAICDICPATEHLEAHQKCIILQER